MSRPLRALFVTYGGGHVGMVLPVIHELERRRPTIEIDLLALTTGHERARAVRPTLGYRDFIHTQNAADVLKWGKLLSAGNKSPDVPYEESVAYLGINYLDLISQHGLDGAADLYRVHGRYAFRPINFMRRLLQDLQPDVVVATNSPRSEQAALEVASEMRIPSVGMVDLFGLESDTYVTRDIKPAWTCVIAEVVRERLIAHGFAAENIVVTGNPAFDGLNSKHSRAQAEQFVSERGWHDLSPVLFAGHVEPVSHQASSVPAGQSLPIEIESVLRDHVRKRDDLALVVRYHPSDWHTFPRLPDEPRVHFSEPPHEPIHPLILASSAVVVQTSTVGLESAMAGKPVISIENSPAAHKWFSLSKQQVSTPCPTPLELPGVLDSVLAGSGVADRGTYRSDGRAASRVANVVLNATLR